MKLTEPRQKDMVRRKVTIIPFIGTSLVCFIGFNKVIVVQYHN